jgi:acyl carrier protein
MLRECEVRAFLYAAVRSIDPKLANALDSGARACTAIGMDSIQAAELSGAIADAFMVNVSVTVAFDHPTIDRLAAYIVRTLRAAPVRWQLRPSGRAHTLGVSSVGASTGA